MDKQLVGDISATLKAMEQGEFQNFCLDFLPLFNQSYNGLIRHGSTADGKTRKGTPDLIKTLANGQQLAVQCSTDNKYWEKPINRKQFSAWKPCEDIDRCITKLNNVVEIILCSNKEIPTTSQNAESEILLYAKKKTKAKITLLCCAKLERFLISNIETLSYQSLFKTYFPKIYNRISSSKENLQNKIAIELLKEKPIVIDDALKIAAEVTSSILDLDKAKAYALKKADEFKSKFDRDPIPLPGKIVRSLPKDYKLLSPVGTVQTLLGVPKIGKTTLIAQCASHWKESKFNIHWFDCPIQDFEINILVRDISRAIWSCFFSPINALKLSNGTLSLQTPAFDSLKYNLDNPSIFILDNAENLNTASIKFLCSTLSKLKSSSYLSNIGFVFISNKRLKASCPSMSSEIPSEPWNQAELKQLLKLKLPECKHYEDNKYLEILETMSKGHPLVAIALTRKFSSPQQLLLSSLSVSSLADEDLAAEVKKLLFDDILVKDKDLLNCVLRLAPLSFRATKKVVNAIMKMKPIIGKPFGLILDQLSGTVIEGDDKQGYSISFVYKEVAKKQLDTQFCQEVYDTVSLVLLKPENNSLNAIEVTEGIFYSILANNFERAFYWSGILLHSMSTNKTLSKTQVQAIIDRLSIVTLMNIPKDSKILPMYYLTLATMAINYVNLGNTNKALELLGKIVIPTYYKSEKDKGILEVLVEVARIYKMLLIAIDDPVGSIAIFSKIDFVKIKNFLPGSPFRIDSLLKEFISVLKFNQIPKSLIEKVITSVDLKNERSVCNLITIALNLAVKASKQSIDLAELLSLVSANNIISSILKLAVQAQYLLEKRTAKNALTYIKQATNLCKKNNILYKSVECSLMQLQGDIYYTLSNKYVGLKPSKPIIQIFRKLWIALYTKNAKLSYIRSIECLGIKIKSFEYAWANYRLGLLSGNAKEAEGYFRKSSQVFNLLGRGYEDLCARSEGERAISLVQLKQNYEFVRIAEWMCRRYYLRNKTEFAPSVTAILAQINRLVCTLENRPIIEEEDRRYPEFERGVYARILNSAIPQAGGIPAFYCLAAAYRLLNNKVRKLKCLRTAFCFEATNDLEISSKILTIKEILSELVPNGDPKEIKEVICFGISIKPSQALYSLPFLSMSVFSALDNNTLSLQNSQKDILVNMLDEIEIEIKTLDYINLQWWLAEISLRKARLCIGHYNKNHCYPLLSKAYRSGIESTNHEVIINAAHTLGFNYAERLGSIREIAEMQLKVVKSISAQNRNFERLDIVGSNLFKFWTQVTWRRLSSSDYKAKHALMNCAKDLEKNGFNVNTAAPIMVLLLCSIEDYGGKAATWAIEKIQPIKSTLPKDILEVLTSYKIY